MYCGNKHIEKDIFICPTVKLCNKEITHVTRKEHGGDYSSSK